ncbi:GLUG motif-containing protein [Achromobacter deleyi]|uniref:GLUG motif-containing protein n=1 Tax=Achromobacter deleyi TaxID=1353891 RepID=UPI00149202BC|nr:GLUG motif-containing protein [Achromobacter deleyi]QVQ28878.1 hypothetical protein HLG70_10955 [Achromobacter deleyi]UIP18994.1 hypothetical protein LYZ39_18540 [Achromobacter deleyi]
MAKASDSSRSADQALYLTTATVRGNTYTQALGGLVGSNQGSVSQSVASGKVNVLYNYAHVGGGLAGVNYGVMNSNATFGEAAKLPVAGANYGTIN